MKDKSDLINQKLKAIEDSKLKIREVNDSNSLKDKKLTEKEKEVQSLKKVVSEKEKIIDNTIYKLKNTKVSSKVTCEDCKEDLEGYGDIKTHILKNCNEEYPEEIIECDNCDFTTLQEFILKLHQKDCQPIKFKCDKCKSKFKTPSQLKTHTQKNHPTSFFLCFEVSITV